MAVLNNSTLIFQFYFNKIENIIQLPQLNILKNVTLDNDLTGQGNQLITNNKTSYFMNSLFEGVYYFNNYSSSYASFLFGRNLTIGRVGPVNNLDAFIDYQLGTTSLNAYVFS